MKGMEKMFMEIKKGMRRNERGKVEIREQIISLIVMEIFEIEGEKIIGMLGIKIGELRVEGGLIMLWIEFEMILEKRKESKEKREEVEIKRDNIRNIEELKIEINMIEGKGEIQDIVMKQEQFNSVGQSEEIIGVILV